MAWNELINVQSVKYFIDFFFFSSVIYYVYCVCDALNGLNDKILKCSVGYLECE